MDTRISAEDWKSTEMIRAENDLFDAVDRTGKEVVEVDRRVAELLVDDRPVGRDEALTFYATGRCAPAELRELVEQVRSGQLTREQALADPRIATEPLAVAALEAATRTSEAEVKAPPRRRTVQRPDYDEEDFSTHTILR